MNFREIPAPARLNPPDEPLALTMVRRGSTVRVRQRALQKRRTSALSRFPVQTGLLPVERALD
jgi:hypothetical protein